VAVVTKGTHVGGKTAKQLFTRQIDYTYLDDESVELGRIDDGKLVVGDLAVRYVILEDGAVLNDKARRLLEDFTRGGGIVINACQLGESISIASRDPKSDVQWSGDSNLRVRHYQNHASDFYFLVNEGEGAIEGVLSVKVAGHYECWDPLAGTIAQWPMESEAGRTRVAVHLARRQSLLLVKSSQPLSTSEHLPAPVLGEAVREFHDGWSVVAADGSPCGNGFPSDWARSAGYETFSGTLRYVREFNLTETEAREDLLLDLGKVGDIARVIINGRIAAVLGWAPYTTRITDLVRPGRNVLDIAVTNSMANAYEGFQLASGLMGPVVMRGVSRELTQSRALKLKV